MDKKKITLSVALAVYNEERNLRVCLNSVASFADEIVIVDGGSSDHTLDIAKEYNACIIRTDNPPIFHINKQKALENSRYTWILQLDADEVVSVQLRDEILSVINGDSKVNGFYIPRKNYFCGRWLSKGGQYPDFLIRLIKRGSAHFPCKSVHEQIAVDGNVSHLVHPLLHYPYNSIAEYWKKADQYINLSAQELTERKVPVNFITGIRFIIVKPIVTFTGMYIRHKGFVDGIWGFLFALFSALHHPIAYLRYVKNDN